MKIGSSRPAHDATENPVQEKKKEKERKGKKEGRRTEKKERARQGKTINLREEGFILAQSLSTQSIMAEKA